MEKAGLGNRVRNFTESLSHSRRRAQGSYIKLSPISSFPVANNLTGWRSLGQWPAAGKLHSRWQAFVASGRGLKLKKRLEGRMSLGRQLKSLFKFDIPGPSFPENSEEGKKKKTLHQPTAHSLNPQVSDSWCPPETGLAREPGPLPWGLFLCPQKPQPAWRWGWVMGYVWVGAGGGVGERVMGREEFLPAY